MTAPKRKCPICGKPRSESHAPFCSTRCRDRDLVKWLDDGYALPGPPASGNSDDEA
ncbi:DNA gyrase inhibitor YacG [Novosphingobium sp. TH158]|uniref:DNA gyrase inhibitor YacG n=1 Tax=Novosphingobium sp. TH158 TaxID=2067455 RepID=UPI000C7A9150|nr:DNA gyrase inhibitor YacG [Novosphingobium sp. TH158]PLK26051.1 DNA gyrase inhibitor YacG [Novosphingobium sp. TH158]